MADEPQRHRIEVACPECGHLQLEPALVISTQCRSCRAHYKVHEGKGVRRTVPTARLAKPRNPALPADSPQPSGSSPIIRPQRFGPSVSPAPRSLLMRLLHPAKPRRQVSCLNCQHDFTTVAEAQSSQCPKCGSYISLLDHEITTAWNRRIETCGNVLIQKTGSVSGVTLRCHDLTAIGTLAGPVECTGTLTIRSSGKVTGDIRCHRLKIEKGARVEFLNPVKADTAVIDGQVRGQLSCSGEVVLEKRARLQGLVRTTSLIVKAGAKHSGTVEMIPAPQVTP